MKNKKIVFVFAIICMLIFSFIYYIFNILGNNKNISKEEIVEKILDKFYNYEANITVEVYSNKNSNIYELYQEVEEYSSKIVVQFPEEIKDLVIENKEGKLIINNSKLNLEKIYEDYENIINNNLFLNTFLQECKENETEIYELENEIIIKVKTNKTNTYSKYKELHFDLDLNVPTQMIIKDNTNKTSIRIIYNDIKIK